MSSLWIQGEKVCGEGIPLLSRNPATDDVVWEGNEASIQQVDQAIQGASEAAPVWRKTPLLTRIECVRQFGQLLEKQREELAQLISAEAGKTLTESRGEVVTSIAKVELSIKALDQRRRPETSELGSHIADVTFRPIGAMLVLGPYNFPAHLPGGQIIPALLAGNTVVFKPSEQVPAVGQWLVEQWNASGLPPGVMNLIQGSRTVAEAAIDHPALGGVLFTGSYAAGVAIHRRLAGRPNVILALEMGGNNPLIVLDGSNHQLTTGAICASAFVTSGQRCTCARRLIVVESERTRGLLDALVDRVARLRVGLPNDDPEPFVGPLISADAAQAVLSAQANLLSLGGTSLVTMKRDPRCPALLSPGMIDLTGFDTVAPDEEYFGPLLQVYRCADLESAIRIAGQTKFGLAAAVLGGQREDFEQVHSNLAAGVINWNRATTGASGALPFGGLGASGNHRPAGFWMVDSCSDPIASLIAESLHDDNFDRSQL